MIAYVSMYLRNTFDVCVHGYALTHLYVHVRMLIHVLACVSGTPLMCVYMAMRLHTYTYMYACSCMCKHVSQERL